MIRARTLAIAAAAATAIVAFAGQASAAYVRLGSVAVGFRVDHDTQWTRFGGRMEGLRLVASRSDIYCRSIRVQYGNGKWDRVFSGRLNEHRPVHVDLAGHSRHVRKIRFVCRSREFRGGRIFISADVGRYRDEWRRSPDWRRFWSHVFNWDRPGGGPAMGWVTLGREHFEGRHDREHRFAGWRGRHVDRIGLRPMGHDARCSRVVITFGNGSTQRIHTWTRGVLRRGHTYRFDLRGRTRNIRRLDLVCRAVRGHRVTIEILARK
jgi:hypothetical protein